MNLFEVEENKYIVIEKEKYEVLNKVKFIEKSSYWFEYKLRNIDNSKIYYLNVELSNLVILYEVLENQKIDIKMNVVFKNNKYQLYEKGVGKVETYYGLTDIGINEQVDYYEYINTSNSQEILSIEKWKDEIEVSIGKIINLKSIKILNK